MCLKNSLTGGIREETRNRFLNEAYGEFLIRATVEVRGLRVD